MREGAAQDAAGSALSRAIALRRRRLHTESEATMSENMGVGNQNGDENSPGEQEGLIGDNIEDVQDEISDDSSDYDEEGDGSQGDDDDDYQDKTADIGESHNHVSFSVPISIRERRHSQGDQRSPPTKRPRNVNLEAIDVSLALEGISGNAGLGYRMQMTGGRNTHTDIKEATFMGINIVLSGSDDGFMLVHCEQTGRLLARLHGDDDIVNCVQAAPGGAHGGLVACSGIDDTVKLFNCSGQYDPLDDSLTGEQLEALMWRSHDSTCQYTERHDLLSSLHDGDTMTAEDLQRYARALQAGAGGGGEDRPDCRVT
jgi:hypothetical protein